MADDGDFEIEIMIYNRHIMRRMVEQGMSHGGNASVHALLTKMGYRTWKSSADQKEIRRLVNMTTLPVDLQGNWKEIALKLAEVLNARPDEIFPGKLKHCLPSIRHSRTVVEVGDPIHLLIM